jgi:hypothetical protein
MPDVSSVGNDRTESSGFSIMTPVQKGFAREAVEMWDDLIETDFTETTDNGTKITLAYSSSTSKDGTYTTAFLVGQSPLSLILAYKVIHLRGQLFTSNCDCALARDWPTYFGPFRLF